MPRPFELLDSVETEEGVLELRRRGDADFMILVGGRVLMTSQLTTSELALAESGCAPVAHLPRPRVLIGGMGLGFTLRAALNSLPKGAHVVVAELNEKVADWCRGPAASVTQGAALDSRVEVVIDDVTEVIRRTAENPDAPRYDAILWDLYVGPERKAAKSHPLYGELSVERTAEALSVGGIFGVWSEDPSPSFEERLRKFNLKPELLRTGGKGLRHAVYLAEKRKPRPAKTPAQKDGPRGPKRRGPRRRK